MWIGLASLLMGLEWNLFRSIVLSTVLLMKEILWQMQLAVQLVSYIASRGI